MTKKYTYSEKSNGQTLSAEEWNNLAQDVDALVTGVNNGTIGGSSSSSSSIVSAVEDTTATDPTVNVSIASGVTAIGTPDVIQLTKKKKGVNTTIVSGNNINIEPRESVSDTKGGNISFKPGDDIEFCSHHRLASNQDEVSIKIINGDDEPVKLQINAASMTLTTKDKVGDDSNVLDINVNSGKNAKGYLKVRAQAIDLRCENTPGGIALQPNGVDSDGHMNKIKFEHGGGDGLEFGTFNTEHTSLFTEDYRFNKDGEIKLATRKKVYSDKTLSFEFNNSGESNNPIATLYSVTQNGAQITPAQDITVGGKYSIIEIAEMFTGLDIMTFQNWYETNKPVIVDILCNGGTHFFFTAALSLKSYGTGDTSTHYEYLKNSEDDFHDFVDSSDPTCTWRDVVYGSYKLKNTILPTFKLKLSYTNENIIYVDYTDVSKPVNFLTSLDIYTLKDITDEITSLISQNILDVTHLQKWNRIGKYFPEDTCVVFQFASNDETILKVQDGISYVYDNKDSVYVKNIKSNSNINISAVEKIKFDTPKLDFGSTFNFGETDNGIETQHKYTANGNSKYCDTLKIIAVNNNESAHTFNTLWDPTANSNAGGSITETTISVPAGESAQIAEASIYDIIKLVNYMKDNNQGPWANNL